MKFEKITEITPAYDKRDSDRGNFGIGSMQIKFLLKGKSGAVQALFGTSIYLPETVEEYMRIGNKGKTAPSDIRNDFDGKIKVFDCWDVGFHSKKRPEYMRTSDKQECCYLGKCYYDGSACRGGHDKLHEKLLREGDKAIWEYLEKYYYEVFPHDALHEQNAQKNNNEKEKEERQS